MRIPLLDIAIALPSIVEDQDQHNFAPSGAVTAIEALNDLSRREPTFPQTHRNGVSWSTTADRSSTMLAAAGADKAAVQSRKW
jgi:hypothetical protein